LKGTRSCFCFDWPLAYRIPFQEIYKQVWEVQLGLNRGLKRFRASICSIFHWMSKTKLLLLTLTLPLLD
jgi:hypothetical protein